ncbi:heterokaryon incompatibility protein-domain-containing protein [Xylariales sp. AK1849]|nr:heterokaryon incompatibility protein-domain-containing protein [Xylariales sp. AK1849]
MENFTYQPLEGRHIRLLDLIPGSRGIIRCHLRHVSLAAKAQYETLSYCWGRTQSRPVKILVNGSAFLVAPNLHAALLRLRDSDHPRTLWIDAICIHQSNIAEKNKQVPLMRAIYKTCQRTVIWLGEHDSHTKFAFEGVKFMASRYGGDELDYYHWRQVARGERLDSDSPLWARIRSLPDRYKSGAAFNSLFTRPWFTRVWVIQELALCPRAIVVCGIHQMDWDLVEKAYATSRTNFEVQNHLGTLLRFRKRPSDIPDDIFCRMVVAWHKDSTDPRDKIYGFMGLTSDQSGEIPINVNYAADVDTVFVDFTRTYLSRTSNLQVLAICRGCKVIDLPNLPSWAIDYSYDIDTEPLPDQLISGTYKGWEGVIGGWTAGGTSSGEPVVSFDGNLLGVQGFQIHSVTGVSIENAPAPAKMAATHLASLIGGWMSGITFCRFYFAAKKMAKDSNPGEVYHPTGQTTLEAFWNIIYGRNPLKGFEKAQASARKDCEDFDRVLTRQVGRIPVGESTASFPLAKVYLALVVLHGLLGESAYLQFFGRIGITKQRRFFTTEKGYMGLGPRETEVGDKVVILQGHRAPIIARHGNPWKVVGECYIHGIMEGEAFDEEKCELLWFE